MAVDPANERSRYNSQLSDIQSDYQEKKRKLVETKEKEIDNVKDYYDQKKENLSTSQEAAVNHIQVSQKKAIDKAEEQRHTIVTKNHEEIKRLDEDYNQKLNETQKDRSEKWDSVSASYKKKLSDQDVKYKEKLQEKKAKTTEDYQKLTQKYRDQIAKTQERQEQNLTQVRSQNEDLIKSERIRGDEATNTLREDLTNKYARVEQTGEKKIQEKQVAMVSKDKRLDEENNKLLASKKANLDKQEEHMETEYSQRYSGKKKANEDLLKGQHRAFESIYQQNETGNHVSLQIQAKKIAKELAEQHRSFMKESSKYSGKESDPFYKVQDRGSELNETAHFYVLKAYAPEHEKDNTQVTIQKDKASVSIQRQFNEKMENDDGKIVSTSSAQTLREEFPFDTPIITEGVGRERSGDYVFVTIPKLQSFKNRSVIKG